MEKRLLEAGKIVNTHGVRGEIKLQPWTDSAEFLIGFKYLYIDGAAFAVLGARAHKSMLILRLEDISDINAAMALKGKTVYFDRDEARLPEGAFFLSDILGARVVLEDGSDIGELKDVLELPAGRVYIVRGEREHMIPAVPEFIINTDISKRVITVRIIEGM